MKTVFDLLIRNTCIYESNYLVNIKIENNKKKKLSSLSISTEGGMGEEANQNIKQ